MATKESVNALSRLTLSVRHVAVRINQFSQISKKAYEFRKHRCTPRPTTIAIVDDVIGTGAHFKAMESILLEQYPGIDVTGLFLARRILLDAKHTVKHIFSHVDPDG